MQAKVAGGRDTLEQADLAVSSREAAEPPESRHQDAMLMLKEME